MITIDRDLVRTRVQRGVELLDANNRLEKLKDWRAVIKEEEDVFDMSDVQTDVLGLLFDEFHYGLRQLSIDYDASIEHGFCANSEESQRTGVTKIENWMLAYYHVLTLAWLEALGIIKDIDDEVVEEMFKEGD